MQSTTTTCKNCGNTFSGRFCNECGEKVFTDHDKSLGHFFEEVFHFTTHFDGTFFNTVRTIFSKPGKLSDDYCFGIRRRYFRPLSLFLLLVVVYLLFPVFEGLNMRLFYHMQHSLYGHYAREKVASIMQERHLTEAQVSELFHHKSEKVSKFMLVIIIPFTALFFWLFTYRKRKYFFDQMVFSTEVNIVYLIWGFMVLPLLLMVSERVYHYFTGVYFSATDSTTALVSYAVLCLYVAVAAWRFYRLTKIKATGLALAFFIAHNLVVQGLYKFLLFVTVINQI